MNMQKLTNPKLGIISLVEGRPEASLEKIRQFILDLDESQACRLPVPLDPDFAQELGERATEAEMMLQDLRDIEGTLRDLD